MKSVIKVLAKEVRRTRALVEVAERHGITYSIKELRSLRWMIAMLIKKEMGGYDG